MKIWININEPLRNDLYKMNFSKSFLDDLRNRTSLSDLIGGKVSWDQKKSRSGQGDFWAPCPFHEEKTASFHVDGQKGFYYCFGCHAKGDCFAFLKDYENLSFLESVSFLSQKLGIPLPRNNSNTEIFDKKNFELLEIMQVASEFYIRELKTSNAIECVKYIESRDIKRGTIDHFEIGFASNGVRSIYSYLLEKGFSPKHILESGLCIEPEKGKEPFDRFRNRIMFPIKDQKGQTIAFGGRSLDPTARAKYLNSPETSLFSKGQIVYNFSNAKPQGKIKKPLIVVEGYMDVISLFQAGFNNVVAPLGTAITEAQLRLMWRLHFEPIIILDGDKAGRTASSKLMSLALPFIEPERSLRFGILPFGQDPDDYLKSEGSAALEIIIERALPIINMLWNDQTKDLVFDSPERRAALELNLRNEIGKIKNSHLRTHFQHAISKMQKSFFSNLTSNDLESRNSGQKKLSFNQRKINAKASDAAKNSLLGQASSNLDVELRLKEGAILLGAINHPIIAFQLENEISRVKFKFADLEEIRNIILEELPLAEAMTKDAFQENISRKIKSNVLEMLEKIPHLKVHASLSSVASASNAKKAIEDAITRHNSLNDFKKEIRIAESEILNSTTEELTSRIQKANVRLQKAIKGSEPLVINNDELTKASAKRLDLMIKEKIWLKKK